MILKQHVVLVISILMISSCKCQNRRIEISQFLNRIGKEASVGMMIVNTQNRDTLISYQQDRNLTPASLLKLLTTSASLELLGTDYRFKTSAYIRGEQNKKELIGDLIVVGGGDPSFGSEYFKQDYSEELIKQISNFLTQRGIKKISGNLIVIDDRYHTIIPGERLWEDIGNYYAAVPHGLTYKDNTFYVGLKSSDLVGSKCKIVDVHPILEGVTFDCQVTALDNNVDNAYIFGVPGLKQWSIRGTIPKSRNNFQIKGALPNPARLFGEQVKHNLLLDGILISGQVVVDQTDQVVDSELIPVTVQESPDLLSIIKIVNQKSNNLFADHLFLEMDLKNGGDGSWSQSSELLSLFWKDRFNNNMIIYDGSGLSPFNAVSASDLVNALLYINNSSFSSEFKSTLAVGGESGTLKNMWKLDKGRVIGKSGSMKGVLNYAGYIESEHGNEYAFSVIINHSTLNFSDLRKEIETLIRDVVEDY